MRIDPCKDRERRGETFQGTGKEGDIAARTRRRRGILRLLAAVGMAALVGGCGNLTAGGATGETTVYVVGNGEEAAAVSTAGRDGSAAGWAATAKAVPGTPPVAGALPGPAAGELDPDDGSDSTDEGDSDDEPEGEMEMRFFLSLVRPDGTTEPLTDDEARIQIDLPGRQEVEVLTRRVPAGRYDGFRVTFTDIDVEIEDGLIIGGEPLIGEIEVELEDSSLVVERPIDLTLGELERAALVVDMNASDWLAAVDPDLLVVAGSVVSDLIEVVVR